MNDTEKLLLKNKATYQIVHQNYIYKLVYKITEFI